MGKYVGSSVGAVGLIMKCRAAGWSPGKTAREIKHAVSKGWLPPCDPTMSSQGPSAAVVRHIIKRETESEADHARTLTRLVYRRYVKRRPVVSRPIDMGGTRDVWIEDHVLC